MLGVFIGLYLGASFTLGLFAVAFFGDLSFFRVPRILYAALALIGVALTAWIAATGGYETGATSNYVTLLGASTLACLLWLCDSLLDRYQRPA